MRMRFWNARFLFAVFAISTFPVAASAQTFGERSDAEFALLGPRMESGLIWEVERRRDEAICNLTEADVRKRTRKSSAAVQKAAMDVWSDARVRCSLRAAGVLSGLEGFHLSAGVGGQFDLNASTQTGAIGSPGGFDPVSPDNKAALRSSGVIGQIGIGYDWTIRNLFSPFRTPGVRSDGFVGVNLDVNFGGGSATVQGVPGIVPFIPAGVAVMDTLKFRNDVSIDFTARIGTFITPMTAVYVLGGVNASSISFRFECTTGGFCGGVAPVTPAFVAEQSKWAFGGVVGFGAETKVAEWLGSRGTVQSIDAAAMSIYVEYRAHLLQPVTIDAGSIPTRFTSQDVDFSNQIVTAGARIRF